MKLAHATLFEDFGTRSLAVHALMVLAFANAVLTGLFVAVGSIAVVTAIIGFLIALGESCDESQRQTVERIDRNAKADGSDIDGYR